MCAGTAHEVIRCGVSFAHGPVNHLVWRVRVDARLAPVECDIRVYRGSEVTRLLNLLRPSSCRQFYTGLQAKERQVNKKTRDGMGLKSNLIRIKCGNLARQVTGEWLTKRDELSWMLTAFNNTVRNKFGFSRMEANFLSNEGAQRSRSLEGFVKIS